MIISPYEQLDTEAQLAPTQANFPALKHFWQCKETSGLTLADAVGGAHLTGSAAMGFGTNFVVPNTAVAAGSNTKVGSFASIATGQYWLLIAVGKFNGGTFGIGDNTTVSRINLGQLGTQIDDTNGVTGLTFPGVPVAYTNSAATYGRATLGTLNAAGGLIQVETNIAAVLTTVSTTTTATLTSLNLNSNNANNNWLCPVSVTALYGAQFWVFNALPKDYLAGIAWTSYQIANGSKVAFPGWKGLT